MQPNITQSHAMRICVGSYGWRKRSAMSSRVNTVVPRFGQGKRLQKMLGPIMAQVPFHPRGGFNSSDETTRCCSQSERLITVCSRGRRHLRTSPPGHGRHWGGVSAGRGALASLEGRCRVRCGAEVSRYRSAQTFAKRYWPVLRRS